MSEVEELKSLIFDRNKAEKWLILGLKQLSRNDLENAINMNSNPAKILLNEYHRYTENPVLKPIIKTIFKTWWRSTVEPILTNVSRVYREITESRPDLKELLDTQRGRRWLNFAVSESYKSLYLWVFKNQNTFLD